MAKPVTHLSLMYERRGVNFTTTLCRRVSNAADDYNVTDNDAEVTCKLCNKRIAIRLRIKTVEAA